jgi:hypothetical protein
MRGLIRAAFVVLLLPLAGCSVLDFDIERDLREQRIEGSPLGGLLGDFFEIPLDVDLASEVAAHDAGGVEAVRFTELTLRITDTARDAGDTDDFDFLDRIEIFIESTRAGTMLERQLVAQLDPVPDGATTIALDTIESVNLKPYVEEGSRITSSGEGTAPPDDVTFDGHMVLLVETL